VESKEKFQRLRSSNLLILLIKDRRAETLLSLYSTILLLPLLLSPKHAESQR
jgi:hypothetical protein